MFFDTIKTDDTIELVTDRNIKLKYTVIDIYKYQKLGGGMWRDLETDIVHTERYVWDKFYGQENNVTLQTCIEKDGNYRWGLLFVVAQQDESSFVLNNDLESR